MTRAAHLLATLVVVAACTREEPPPVPPPGIPRGTPINGPTAPTGPTAPSQRGVSPTDPASWKSRTPVGAATRVGAETNPASSPPEALPASTPPPAERDLSEELVALVGAPSSCFAKRTAGSGTTLSFQVNAAVTPTGMITRAEVSGGGLTAEEADCVKARVVAARFAAPVEGAPLSVQATVDLRERAPEKKPTQ